MFLCLCLLPLLSPSGALESSIVGGRVAKPHSRPYMASLQLNKKHQCGGMLIREDYVLTAAHCPLSINKPAGFIDINLEVLLGAHNISKQEPSQQRIQVKKYYKHPNYKQDAYSNDIMLLKLKTKAKLNKFVKVIGLPKKNVKIPARVECSIAGWGMKTPGGAAESVLREVTLKLEFNFECKYKWKEYFNTEHMICSVSDGERAFCKGDSGGPLFCEGKPRGLATYTSRKNCTDPKYPELYTNIPYFLPWIRETMGKNDIADFLA